MILPLTARVIVGSMRKYVDDKKAVEVVFGSFTRKRLRAGDLLRVDAIKEQSKPKPSAKAKTKSEKAKG